MHSVREFVEAAFKHVGVEIAWEGEAENVRCCFLFGVCVCMCVYLSKVLTFAWNIITACFSLQEIGKDKATGAVRVRVNPKYYRPTEVEQLLGNPAKAERVLGWKAKVTFQELVSDMMTSDLQVMATNPDQAY